MHRLTHSFWSSSQCKFRLDLQSLSAGHFAAGYTVEQATKPQTLGYGLNDSPAGLLAWIVEKFHTWSDRRGSNGKMPYSKDFLLTNVCLYWLTGNITSSFRLYYEAIQTGDRAAVTGKLYCKVMHAHEVQGMSLQGWMACA